MSRPFCVSMGCIAGLALLVAAEPLRAQGVPPSVLPGLGPGATRTVVDGDQPPWRGVVLVQTEVGLRCTGALVGPHTVMTAAHCLFGRGTGLLVRPGSIHVLAGYRRGSFEGHARAVAVEIGPGFGVGPDGRRLPGSPVDADWAVLSIDVPLGTPDRVLPLFQEPLRPGMPVQLGGFEQDRAQLIVADLACQLVGTARNGDTTLLEHSCAGTRGASGAPLLTRTADGRWAVLGIVSGARVGVPGGDAVPIGTIVARSTRLQL